MNCRPFWMQFWWAFGKPHQSLCCVPLYITAFFLITPQCQPDQRGNHSWNQRRICDYIKKTHESKGISQIRAKLGTSKYISVCINRGVIPWAMSSESIAVNAPYQPVMPTFCTWDSPVELMPHFKVSPSSGKPHNNLRLNPPLLESRLGWNWIMFLNKCIFPKHAETLTHTVGKQSNICIPH